MKRAAPTSHFYTVTLIQLLLGPVAIAYLLLTHEYVWLLATFVFWFLGYVMGEGIFYHRYFSHRTFETHSWIAKVFAMFALLCGFGGPISWRAVHIGLHHAYSDKPGDSHSPKDGFWHSWILWTLKPLKPPMILCKSLLKDKYYVFLETHIVKIWWTVFVILGLVDFRLPLFTLGLSSFIAICMAGLSNCYSHMYGSRRFSTDDNSRNNWWLSWLTWQGGVLHNNHHALPSRHHDSHAWYEFDIAKYIIPLISTKINHRK